MKRSNESLKNRIVVFSVSFLWIHWCPAAPTCLDLFPQPGVDHSYGSTFKIEDPSNDHFYIEANLDSEGILTFTIATHFSEFGLRSSLQGHQLFNRMISYFGEHNINTIRGRWIDGTNHEQYLLHLDQGLTPEEAALGTWTGRMAAQYGFSIVRSLHDTRPHFGIRALVVDFIRPLGAQ
jgi:hypothetical protein